jgi:hypothetical protein
MVTKKPVLLWENQEGNSFHWSFIFLNVIDFQLSGVSRTLHREFRRQAELNWSSHQSYVVVVTAPSITSLVFAAFFIGVLDQLRMSALSPTTNKFSLLEKDNLFLVTIKTICGFSHHWRRRYTPRGCGFNSRRKTIHLLSRFWQFAKFLVPVLQIHPSETFWNGRQVNWWSRKKPFALLKSIISSRICIVWIVDSCIDILLFQINFISIIIQKIKKRVHTK